MGLYECVLDDVVSSFGRAQHHRRHPEGGALMATDEDTKGGNIARLGGRHQLSITRLIAGNGYVHAAVQRLTIVASPTVLPQPVTAGSVETVRLRSNILGRCR